MATLFVHAHVQNFSKLIPPNGYTLVTRSRFEDLYTPRVRLASGIDATATATDAAYPAKSHLSPVTGPRREIPIDALTAAISTSSTKTLMKIKDLAVSVCGGVGETYAQEAVVDGLAEDAKYDILVAIPTELLHYLEAQDETVRRTPDFIETLKDSVHGLIVVQKGECKDFEKAWCVKLICVKPGTISGRILMGACLYCVAILVTIDDEKTATIDDEKTIYPACLLELANGFFNLSGYYSYTASGYTVDPTLFSDSCFHNEGCVTMRYDIVSGRDNVADIIARVMGRPLDPKTDAPYNLLDPEKKTSLSRLSNIIQKNLVHTNKEKLITCRDQILRRLDILFKLQVTVPTFDTKEREVLKALKINRADIPIDSKIAAVQASIDDRWREFISLLGPKEGGRRKKTRSKKTRSKKTRSKKTRRRKQ